ncbi:hypothetical protein D3C76_995400 [compost metagenome]
MDGRTEEHPGLLRRQGKPIGDHRVEDHRQRGQRRHADHGKQRGAFLLRVIGQRGRQGQCRRGAADCRGTAGEHAEEAIEAQKLGRQDRNGNGHHHNNHHQGHRLPAQGRNLFQGDAHPQQGHTQAQDSARGELDTGLALAFAGEKIQRNTQQQREQHYRRTIVFGKEGRRGGNDHADEKSRCQFEDARVNIDESD